MADGPLKDVRILDLTHVWAGPLATRILADLGAQIVKVEAPMGRGPKVYPGSPISGYIGGEPGPEPWNVNAAFVKLQRNKRSLALNLKHAHGREVFLNLVEHADIVMENFSARAMHRLKLDYENLKKVNPQIIHIAMPGYGLDGSYRDRVAFGPTVEPMSGLTSIMGYIENDPRCTAMAIPDPTAAVNACAAVLTALREREKTGTGGLVEMSLHEAAVNYSGPWLIETQLGGQLKVIGNRHPEMAPHGVYRCRGDDSWVAIGCAGETQWQSLCELIGNGLDRHWSFEKRVRQADTIDSAIETWTCNRTATRVVHELQNVGVAAGSINDTQAMLQDEHVQSRGFFVNLEHGIPIPGTPIKMTDTSTDDWTPCPKLGADNEYVLKTWLSYKDETIEDLYADQSIVNEPPR